MKTLEQQVAELRELEADWDSYGALPIKPEHIDSALDFLEQVKLVPTNTGGVDLIWKCHGMEIQILFDDEGIEGFAGKWSMGENGRMNLDLKALREKAQAAKDIQDSPYNIKTSITIWPPVRDEFRAAATPEVVLQLLDELEHAQGVIKMTLPSWRGDEEE